MDFFFFSAGAGLSVPFLAALGGSGEGRVAAAVAAPLTGTASSARFTDAWSSVGGESGVVRLLSGKLAHHPEIYSRKKLSLAGGRSKAVKAMFQSGIPMNWLRWATVGRGQVS